MEAVGAVGLSTFQRLISAQLLHVPRQISQIPTAVTAPRLLPTGRRWVHAWS